MKLIIERSEFKNRKEFVNSELINKKVSMTKVEI